MQLPFACLFVEFSAMVIRPRTLILFGLLGLVLAFSWVCYRLTLP